MPARPMSCTFVSHVADPLAVARGFVATKVHSALGGPPELLEEYRTPPGDPGLFGPGSAVWQVHGDLPAMLVGGISSLMLQSLHPAAMAGVDEHSRYRDDPLGRLRRTTRFVAGTTFGGLGLVETLVDEVRRIHRRVRGTTAQGTAYAADDPALLTWVHVAEVWSFLRSYQRYGTRPLLRSEKDRYLDRTAEIAVLLGACEVPRSVEQVRSYLQAVRGDLAATPAALEAVRFLRTPLSDGVTDRLAHHAIVDAAVDLLPGFARRELALPDRGMLERGRVRATMTSVAAVLRWGLGPSPVVGVATQRALASSVEHRRAQAVDQHSVESSANTGPGSRALPAGRAELRDATEG
jgi:uncharacterized protein (DUF2236 family)